MIKTNTLHALGAGTALAAALAAALATSVDAAPARGRADNPLRVGMLWLGDGHVEVTVTNTSRKAARVPAWSLPTASAESDLFHIVRDGADVGYEGRMVKRAAPTNADFALLMPGESVSAVVDLGEHYDLSRGGHYTVTFAAPLQAATLGDGTRIAQANGRAAYAQSAPLRLSLDAGTQSPTERQRIAARAKPGGGSATVVNGVSYVGCSSTQINSAGNAVMAARNYSENAKGYLNTGTVGPRYTSWFGAYTSSRYGTARQNFTAIDAAMDQTGGQIKINCGCNQSYFAYVYPTRPYEIFVCRAFWNAQNTGTDSKAGTLIHEMSHFNVVAGTEDYAYGQTAARNLALSDPNRAVDNADNHEYFAENTPSQN